MNEQEIKDIDDLNELDNLRKEYLEKGRFKELLLVCERALEIEPDDYIFSFWLATALYETKEYSKAIHLSKKLLRKSSRKDALVVLGSCYLRIGSYTKAIEAFEGSIDEHSETSGHNYILGLAYRERSKQDNDLSVKHINQAKLLEPEVESKGRIKEFLEFFQ